ncbi:unnamed protein product [Ectocarpus sp. 12 AP-2014]
MILTNCKLQTLSVTFFAHPPSVLERRSDYPIPTPSPYLASVHSSGTNLTLLVYSTSLDSFRYMPRYFYTTGSAHVWRKNVALRRLPELADVKKHQLENTQIPKYPFSISLKSLEIRPPGLVSHHSRTQDKKAYRRTMKVIQENSVCVVDPTDSSMRPNQFPLHAIHDTPPSTGIYIPPP